MAPRDFTIDVVDGNERALYAMAVAPDGEYATREAWIVKHDDEAEVWAIETHEAYRRQGAATALMHYFMDVARAWGCSRVTLFATEEGQRLYESLGFSRCNGMYYGMPAMCYALRE